MQLSFGIRTRLKQQRARITSRGCSGRWGLALLPACVAAILAALWLSRRGASKSPYNSSVNLVLRHPKDNVVVTQHESRDLSDSSGADITTTTDYASDTSVTESRVQEMVSKLEKEQTDAANVDGKGAGDDTATSLRARPPLNLFLVWTGSSALPVAEFERLLTDVISQTSVPRVHLFFLLDDSHMAGKPREAIDALFTRCRDLAQRGGRTSFGWTISSVQSFEGDSGAYRHICADFKANVSPGAQVYTCNYLFKPLMWEIVSAESLKQEHADGSAVIDGVDYSGIVLALDTDLRIAGDVSDMLLEHVPHMKARGAVFALVEEQQPTYAFNSPKQAQGWNGGVQLIDVGAMRDSSLYRGLVSNFTWSKTDPRWRPATDLGDQTLYSVLNWTNPQLFHPMDCEWNRQMCRIWFTFFPGRDRTAKADFLHYERKALCSNGKPIRILHGNCKSNRPGSDELAGLPDAWQPRNEQAEAELQAQYERIRDTPEEVLQGKVKPPQQQQQPAPIASAHGASAAAADAPKRR